MTGKSMSVSAAWAMQNLADQPDLIIVDCVVALMLRTVKVLEDMYEIALLLFSPVDLGIPSSGPRRCTLLRLRVKTMPVMSDGSLAEFCFRSCRIDGSIYLAAQEPEVHRDAMERRLRDHGSKRGRTRDDYEEDKAIT